MRHMRFTDQSAIATLYDHAANHLPDGRVRVAAASPVVPAAPADLSYAELAGLVDELSGWFPAAGVRPGATVVIAKANHPDIQLLAAAASRAGALPALVSAAVPAEQARVMFARLNPAAIVTDRALAATWGLGPDDPWRTILVDGAGAGRGGGRAPKGAVPADDLRGSAPAPVRPPGHTDPMVVTHTSGTTGVPKLVAHSAATVAARARVVTWPVPVMSIRRRDRYAAYLPWNHARALEFLTSSLHIGCPLLALSDPDGAALAPELAPFRPTVVESVPNVYLLWEAVAREAAGVFGRVRAYLNAFDAMHPRTVRAFLEAAPRRALWLQGYGQSEVGCVTVAAYTRRTVRPRPDRPPTLRDMGWASPPVTGIRVTDPDTGFPLGAGRVGQLEVHTGGRVLTYVGEEDLHARRVRGKWWTTGDMGTVSRTGRARLDDRHVDTIDGLDSCLEVEDRLLDALPEATEVAVLKVGDRAVPVVCTVEDRPLEPGRWEAVRGLAGPQAARLDPPVHLPWDAVPRTGTYKVRRHVLVDQLLASTEAPAAAPADALATA